MTTVLVADADRRWRATQGALLSYGGFDVITAPNEEQAISLLRRCRVDAVLVDPMGSREVVAGLRLLTRAPIIVVSGDDEEPSKVRVLDAGADDYVSKPFGVEELLARLRAVIRRSATATERSPVATPHFLVDVAGRRALRSDGSNVRLTPTEWRIVEELVFRPGHLVAYQGLEERIWGADAHGKRDALRVNLAAIRHKLEPEPARPRYFVTMPKLGVAFLPDGGDAGAETVLTPGRVGVPG